MSQGHVKYDWIKLILIFKVANFSSEKYQETTSFAVYKISGGIIFISSSTDTKSYNLAICQ